MIVLRIAALLIICLPIAGCFSNQNNIIGVGTPSLAIVQEQQATIKRIFIATTRAQSENPVEFFSGERSSELTLGFVDVSIPKAHKVGQIEKNWAGKPNAEKHFTITTPTLKQSDTEFTSQLQNTLDTLPNEERDILIFVHGYNSTFSDAVLRTAQFVHDTGYKGVPVLFSWASRGNPTEYVYDINSALQARGSLVKLGLILNTIETNNYDVVAHSMGSLVTLEAIRALSKRKLKHANRLRQVILASPDIDIDLFAALLKDLESPEEVFHVLVSADDKALNLSKYIAGGISRAGAADPKELAHLGVNVIDLTEIDDKTSTHHSKFAASPDIVKLIGNSINDGNTLVSATPPSDAKKLVGGLLRGITIIPVTILGETQSVVLKLSN